jgi:hypothetical protein
MTQMRTEIGSPRAMLSPDQMRDWKRQNMLSFDRLPPAVRLAIRESGIEVDCGKLEGALAHGVAEMIVIETIFDRAKLQRDRLG